MNEASLKGRLAGLPRILLPRIEDLIFIGVFLMILALGPRMINVDGDLGRHLTVGQYILDQGRIPTQDLFSHTRAGAALTPHEWLSEVLFALSYRWLGLTGVVLLCGLVLAVASVLLYRLAVRRSRLPVASLAFTLLAAAASSLHWLARPHLFTILLLVVWLSGLEDLWEGKKAPLAWMPLVMLVWANLHGAFIAGLVTWGIFGVGALGELCLARKEHPLSGRPFLAWWGAAGGLSLLATLVNPDGPGLWKTSLGYLGNTYLVTHTQEYLSPDFHNPSAWPFLLMILLVILLLGLRSTGRMRTADLLLVSAWTAMALVSQRNIPLFAVVTAPCLVVCAADWLREARGLALAVTGYEQRMAQLNRNLVGWLWPALLIVGAVLLPLNPPSRAALERWNSFSPQVFPVQAVDWMVDHPQPGKMFNYFPWGGYLLYRLWPEQTVFIDGQTDFYGEALTRQYETVLTQGDGWQAVLDQYDVSWAILPTGSALSREIQSELHWQAVYHDPTATILTRQP